MGGAVKFLLRIFTRWIFWAALAGLLLAYAAGGFLLVPRLVRSQLVTTIDENFYREAHVGEVRFNPFSFVLEIDDYALLDTDGRAMLQFRGLLVNLELISILRRAYSFDAIALDAPGTRLVIRPDGSLNLADLAAKKGPAEPSCRARAVHASTLSPRPCASDPALRSKCQLPSVRISIGPSCSANGCRSSSWASNGGSC